MKIKLSEFIIIKRDGEQEHFDPDKIIRVAEAAGLDVAKANRLAKSVSKWLVSQKHPRVSSLDLRDKIQELLNTLSPHVADLYRWYQKTRELHHD